MAESWDLSLDRAKLVTVYATTSSGRLLVLDLSSGRQQTIESEALANAQSIAWLGDGSFMVTKAFGERGSDVLQVTPSGAVTSVWSSRFQRLWRPTVSPDGRHIAFASSTIEGAIWMLEGFLEPRHARLSSVQSIHDFRLTHPMNVTHTFDECDLLEVRPALKSNDSMRTLLDACK